MCVCDTIFEFMTNICECNHQIRLKQGKIVPWLKYGKTYDSFFETLSITLGL